MKLKKLSILSLIIAVMLCSCGTNVGEELKTADILLPATTENDLTKTEYEKICENDSFIFSINKDTTAFKVTDKANGYEWYSTAGSVQTKAEADAPFTISYVNESGLIENMNAMTDSIALGQYKIEKLSDGARVTYSLGEYNVKLNIPYALTKERKQEILESIEDDFKANQFDIMYQFVNYDRLDEENQKKFSALYPTIHEEPLYVLRDSITNSKDKLKELDALLKDSGYTDEMYKEDSKLFTIDDGDEEEETPQFRVQLVYKLTDSGLTVTVPHKEIQMSSKFPLLEIELLKYFGSPDENEKGYFLLPDGSGSIMNFYNGKGDLQNYSVNIYGNDKAIAENENIYTNEQAYLPIFAIKTENNAMFAVIEKGASIATVNAYPGGERLIPYASASFKLRAHYRSYTTSGNDASNYFVSIENERYKDDVVVNYTFLNGSDANYTSMAQLYRNRLFGDKKGTVNTGAVVELVGMIDKDVSFVGIKSNKKLVLTDFKAVEKIANELNASGIKNLKIKYSGFANGAYYGKYSDKLKLNSKLGSEKEFTALYKKLAELGIGFYPDVDLQYTYKTAAFDGFSVSKDASTLISKSKGYLIRYNPATFMRDPDFKTPAYINSPLAVSRAFSGFFNDFNKYKIGGVSLRSIGSDLNANYSDSEGIGREKAMNMMVASLSKLNDYSIITSGCNAYALPFTDYCNNIPLTSAEFDITDEAVPFVQMVISGVVGYSGPVLNLEGDINNTLLKMASIAADPYYMLSAQSGDQVVGTDYSFLYSSDYGYLKEDMISLIKAYQKDMESVSGKKIVNYRKLSDRIYCTDFENGYSVIVNYNDKDISLNGATYTSKSYTVVKGEN